MAAFARAIARLAGHCERSLLSSFPTHPSLPLFKSLAEKFQVAAAELLDLDRLDELHWDEESGIYADFGFHTDKVALVPPPMDRAPMPGQSQVRYLCLLWIRNHSLHLNWKMMRIIMN